MFLYDLYQRLRQKRAFKWVFVVDSKGFINTEKGWNLYAECMEKGNMKPYYQAKLDWQRGQVGQGGGSDG